MVTFVLQNGWSPLHTASSNGRLEVVKTLIAAGANIRQVNKVGIVFIIQCHCITCVLLV